MDNLDIMIIMMKPHSIIGIAFDILKTAMLVGIQNGVTGFMKDKFMELIQLKQQLEELKSSNEQQEGDK